jgi:hypothetical protein
MRHSRAKRAKRTERYYVDVLFVLNDLHKGGEGLSAQTIAWIIHSGNVNLDIIRRVEYAIQHLESLGYVKSNEAKGNDRKWWRNK